MDARFDVLATDCELSADADQQLGELGFVVMPGPVPPDGLEPLAEAYDVAVGSAAPGDISIGCSTTRVHDFVNRGPAFDSLYVFPPLLEACCHVIGEAFKLSTIHARTLRAYSLAQNLHVDFERDAAGFPMVGFIFMLDDFRPDNGATRFVPGSHTWSTVPKTLK
jgi:Phytanoyl-CoA dioxygenase (PhyH)